MVELLATPSLARVENEKNYLLPCNVDEETKTFTVAIGSSFMNFQKKKKQKSISPQPQAFFFIILKKCVNTNLNHYCQQLNAEL